MLAGNMNWLAFALMTVVSWGLYGIFLHSGQVSMGDKQNGLFKAFLFVGLAYFLTAIIAPLLMLVTRKATWNFPSSGMGWSLVAGIVGAIGAFCVLLAFNDKGSPGPGVVMSIVFAGAPVVNAVVAVVLHPPAGGLSAIKPQFYLGIILAAVGGCLVTYYKPPPPKAAPAPTAQVSPGGTASAKAN
jgi:drug/metabolite transporter (DMT)-like permease